MSKDKKSILEKIGFNKKESDIYKALLEMGPSSISDIVRKTGHHRPMVYHTLPMLIEKGVIGVMPKGKYKKYTAESPDKLERLFTNLESEFNLEIQGLYETYESSEKKPIVSYAEGGKAITSVYSDVVHSLKKGDMYFRYSSAMALNRERYVPKDYRRVRDEKGLERWIITNHTSRHLHNKKLGRAVKAVPSDFDLFDYNITQIIYGDKVSIIDFNTKTTITIKNKMIAEFQKKIFKLLFKKL